MQRRGCSGVGVLGVLEASCCVGSGFESGRDGSDDGVPLFPVSVVRGVLEWCIVLAASSLKSDPDNCYDYLASDKRRTSAKFCAAHRRVCTVCALSLVHALVSLSLHLHS